MSTGVPKGYWGDDLYLTITYPAGSIGMCLLSLCGGQMTKSRNISLVGTRMEN